MTAINEIILTVREIPGLGIEADVISPDVFAGKDTKEIGNLEAYHGNKKEGLKKFFSVEGDLNGKPENLRIIIEGDVSRVKRIGQGMSAGEILIRGNVGMHLGSKMKGGKITVDGNTASWIGMEMSGGKIEIGGNAGNFVGSAYRGNWEGMEGGEILIHGDVGSNTGGCMMGGKITIKGSADEFLGIRMQGGLILVEGNIASRAGAEMHGGTIVVWGKVNEMLPSFKKDGVVEKVEIDGLEMKKVKNFSSYIGDLAENGKGKIYVKE